MEHNRLIDRLLVDLNAPQAEAVQTTEGALLILAGAGTGKTRTLTTRFAYLLETGLSHPSRILAATFTNKAAQEMKERIISLSGQRLENLPWLGTFHSICLRIIRRHAEAVELKSNFTILDMLDQKRLVKEILKQRNLDEKQYPHATILYHIEHWKNRGLHFEQIPKEETAHDPIKKLSASLWRDYQNRLKKLNAADFGDLINECCRLFQQNPDVLAKWQKRFEFIMVDEYQDTNIAQHILLKQLAGSRQNICCVGDDDQSIYGWRGAEINNILCFEKDFPKARIIRLEQNYRSSKYILGAATSLISHNQSRLGKTLWTDIKEGKRIEIWSCADGKDESYLIGNEITKKRLLGESLNSMAILVRASFQMRAFEEACLTLNIPYRIIGSARFYERAEIRNANAYFRLVAKPEDDLAFQRIINVPRRGLGQISLLALEQLARSKDIALLEAAAFSEQALTEAGLKKRAAIALNQFAAQIAAWRERSQNMLLEEFAALLLEESGMMMMWKNQPLEEQSKLDYLKELLRAIGEFGTLSDYLEHVALVASMDEDSQKGKACINIMTLHAAKGLEFTQVFLPGWEEELFPHRRALEAENGLEEERRLAYVGLTRAKKSVLISFAQSRLMFNEWRQTLPSPFIAEIGEAHIEFYQRMTATHKSDPNVKGMRVSHDHFGQGTITAADGDHLTILFDHVGRKMIKASFIQKI